MKIYIFTNWHFSVTLFSAYIVTPKYYLQGKHIPSNALQDDDDNDDSDYDEDDDGDGDYGDSDYDDDGDSDYDDDEDGCVGNDDTTFKVTICSEAHSKTII